MIQTDPTKPVEPNTPVDPATSGNPDTVTVPNPNPIVNGGDGDAIVPNKNEADKVLTSEKQATETLSQTNEKSTMSSWVAGLLVLLTTLDFADARRRH